jgi:hypothetical protein
MKVLLDGNPLDIASDALEKDRILAEVRRACAAQGRVMQSLAVDGVPLEEEAFLVLEGGTVVEIATTPLRDLIRSSLDEAMAYLPRLTKGFGSIADHLEADDKNRGLSMLTDALEGVGWIVKVLANTHALLGAGSDQDLPLFLGQLQQKLESLAGALEGSRFFEVAFQIREELLPALEALTPRVEALRALAEGDAN